MQVGKKIWRATVGGRTGEIPPRATSYRTAEGARPTAYILGETQHWRAENHGHDMYAAIQRNLGKSREGAARALATTNAFRPGEDSIAERDYDAWLEQSRGGRVDILYDSVEPVLADDFDEDDDEVMMEGIAVAYGDSLPFISPSRIMAEVRSPTVTTADAKRFYLNLRVAGAGAWMNPSAWDASYRSRLAFPLSRTKICSGT